MIPALRRTCAGQETPRAGVQAITRYDQLITETAGVRADPSRFPSSSAPSQARRRRRRISIFWRGSSTTSANFVRTLALPAQLIQSSVITLLDRLAKIAVKVVHHGRAITFQTAEVIVSRQLFADILALIAQLRSPLVPA
jgi:hypothetical protein